MNVTRGNMFFTHRDGVVGDLAFTRTFNTDNVSANRYGRFGPGWNNSFEPRLRFLGPKTILARSPEGDSQYYYDPQLDDTFAAVLPHSVDSWIVKEPASYRRLFRAGGEEVYDTSGRLLSVVERSGLTTTYTADAQGRLSSVQRLGRGFTLTYVGASTRPHQLRGPQDTLLATYTYDTASPNLLRTVEYADGSGYRYTYEPWPHRLLTVEDLEGKKIEAHTYDPVTGQTLTSEVGDGIDLLTFTYEPNQTLVNDARGNVTTYTHAMVRGVRQVTKVVGPCASCGGNGSLQEWVYDAQGRITSYVDGELNVTAYTYDAATGDLLTETRRVVANDPGTALVNTYTYHPDGRLATRTDPRQALTTWTYETEGNDEKQTVRQQVSGTRTRETLVWRNSIGRPRLIQDPRGRQTELFYTPAGDLDYVRDPAGKVTDFSYDPMGRRTQVIHPAATPAALEPIFAYDVRGQVRTITDPTDPGKYTLITYDRGGRRKEVRDALLRRTEYVYDLYSRLTFVKRWLGPSTSLDTQYHYDAMSNLEWIEDARGKRTHFEYDGHNRVRRILYPPDTTEVRAEEFSYDEAGRVETRTDRRGITTTYNYDGLSRLTGKSYVGGGESWPAVSFFYDGASNLTRAQNGSAVLTWDYFLTGEPESASQRLLSSGQRLTTTYSYDDAGSRTGLSTNDFFSLAYDDDAVGRPWHIYRGADVFTFQYDDASRRRSLSYPNGAVTTWTPDTLSRLDVVETTRDAVLSRFDYGFDDVGNRTSKATPAVNETYTYDEVYQLDTVSRNAALTEDLGHDPVGNRTSTLALPSPTQWTYSNRNELQAMGTADYGYDPNGNLTSRSDSMGEWTYEWDAENTLRRATRNGAEVARYQYDALGRRVEKMVGAARTTYVYDGEDILRERVGTASRYYVHGPGIDEPLARVSGGTATYLHADGLGSIVGHTNSAGALVYSRSYDAFGNLETGASESGYAFTGREWNPETGLYYYRARVYDPGIGRFISEDPIGFSSGINFYSYVENNPVNWTDPSGYCPFCVLPWVPAAATALTKAAVATGILLTGAIVGTAIAEIAPPPSVTTVPPGGGTTTTAPSKPTPVPVPPPPYTPDCGPPDCPAIKEFCIRTCRSRAMTTGSFKTCYDTCVRIISKNKCNP